MGRGKHPNFWWKAAKLYDLKNVRKLRSVKIRKNRYVGDLPKFKSQRIMIILDDAQPSNRPKLLQIRYGCIMLTSGGL